MSQPKINAQLNTANHTYCCVLHVKKSTPTRAHKFGFTIAFRDRTQLAISPPLRFDPKGKMSAKILNNQPLYSDLGFNLYTDRIRRNPKEYIGWNMRWSFADEVIKGEVEVLHRMIRTLRIAAIRRKNILLVLVRSSANTKRCRYKRQLRRLDSWNDHNLCNSGM